MEGGFGEFSEEAGEDHDCCFARRSFYKNVLERKVINGSGIGF